MKKETKNYTFFNHKDCEYFPCHKTRRPDDFNCLFCFCPLYTLGDKCGGNFTYTENGIKDCVNCLVPHRRDSHALMVKRFPELAELAKEKK